MALKNLITGSYPMSKLSLGFKREMHASMVIIEIFPSCMWFEEVHTQHCMWLCFQPPLTLPLKNLIILSDEEIEPWVNLTLEG